MPLRRTKIIATLGPASSGVDEIRALIRAGAACFRLNFSHGSGESMEPVVKKAREAMRLEGVDIPLLADIQGPKLRVGKMPEEGVTLMEGESFIITGRKVMGSSVEVYSPYEYLTQDVKPGTRILLADGALELEVEKIMGGDVYTRVLIGGRLYSNKGMNIPNTKLSVETLTQKDKEDLDYVSRADIDLVAISFVRNGRDIEQAREYLHGVGKPVLAKLEVTEAFENLDEIIESSDGVLIARGDLGVEVPFEKVPTLQKQILRKTALRGKWAMVATQMLGSMVLNSRPSRAEVSDVANAVIDGADALMLSEETAVGKHSSKAVEAMAKIAYEAEDCKQAEQHPFDSDIISFSAGAAGAAVSACERLRAKAIVVLAGSGTSALLLSKWKPRTPVLALGSKESSLRRANILRGVIPLRVKENSAVNEQISLADEYLVEKKFASYGDTVIIVGVATEGEEKEPNMIRFHKVGAVPEQSL